MKFPHHECGLYLEHNRNRDYYKSVAEEITDDGEFYHWPSPEAKQRAIDTNELWTLQWYPNTPVGFFAVAAPTLEELLEYANREDFQ